MTALFNAGFLGVCIELVPYRLNFFVGIEVIQGKWTVIDFNYKNCFCVTLFIYFISLTLRSTLSPQENFYCMLVCAYKLFSFLWTYLIC